MEKNYLCFLKTYENNFTRSDAGLSASPINTKNFRTDTTDPDQLFLRHHLPCAVAFSLFPRHPSGSTGKSASTS